MCFSSGYTNYFQTIIDLMKVFYLVLFLWTVKSKMWLDEVRVLCANEHFRTSLFLLFAFFVMNFGFSHRVSICQFFAKQSKCSFKTGVVESFAKMMTNRSVIIELLGLPLFQVSSIVCMTLLIIHMLIPVFINKRDNLVACEASKKLLFYHLKSIFQLIFYIGSGNYCLGSFVWN